MHRDNSSRSQRKLFNNYYWNSRFQKDRLNSFSSFAITQTATCVDNFYPTDWIRNCEHDGSFAGWSDKWREIPFGRSVYIDNAHCSGEEQRLEMCPMRG